MESLMETLVGRRTNKDEGSYRSPLRPTRMFQLSQLAINKYNYIHLSRGLLQSILSTVTIAKSHVGRAGAP
jgi:hypothetical protein